jgi:hypothetical protein
VKRTDKTGGWRACWAVCLTAFVPLTLSHAATTPYVLIVAPQDTARPGVGNRQLVKFSAEGRRVIADQSGYTTMFGMDDSTLVLVNSFTNENRLLVVDRQSLKIVSDRTLTGVSPGQRMQSVEELIAVHSKSSTVYLQTLDDKGHRGFGFAEVNWKTGKVRQFPESSPREFGDIVHLISLPAGFAVSNFRNSITLFDATTQKHLKLQEQGDDYSWMKRRMYYVPTIGLMEYYEGEHRQLTDTNLSEVPVNPQRFPGPEVQSKIFVRNINGKPCLIWGENKEPDPTRNYQTTVTEIVFYDLESKKEVWRKALGGNFSEYIQPNQTGTRVYVIAPQTGEIFCLNRESQTMSSFARTGVKAGSHSYAVVVDAN